AVALAAELGFTHVEVAAESERPPADLEALADAGVHVASAELGRGLPPGHALDARDLALRRATLSLLQRQVADAARLGATVVSLKPGADPTDTGLVYFAEGCALLAAYAGKRMVRLCVEPDSEAVLAWRDRVRRAHLGLLL